MMVDLGHLWLICDHVEGELRFCNCCYLCKLLFFNFLCLFLGFWHMYCNKSLSFVMHFEKLTDYSTGG